MIERLQKMTLKDQCLASPISNLPNEVFAQVFSHFSVFELASFERVSSSWKKTIRSHQTLWRDDGFEERPQDVCAPKHMKKFRIMLQRGGGKLNRIFLPICLASNSHRKVKKLLKTLSSTEVQELWIVVRGDFASSHGSKYFTPVEDPTGIHEAVIKTVLETVVQCGNLTSLRLVCTRCVTVDMSNFGDPAKWPFISCRLRKLSLFNIRYTSLFPKKGLYKVVSNTKEMDVYYEGLHSCYEDVDVWPLIRAAKDALVKCRTSYPQNSGEEIITTPSHIFFPNLKVLRITIQNIHFAFQNLYPTSTRYMPNCPKLEELYVFGTLPFPMLENLLSNKIEKLGLCLFPEKPNQKKALIKKMHSCTKVRSLLIAGFDIKILKELYTSKLFEKIPLEEITCLKFSKEMLDIIKNIIQDRRRSKGKLSTIVKATFTTLLGHPSELEWFSQNVEEVKWLSKLSEVSFMYLFMKGLYNFEAGGHGIPKGYES